MIKIAIDHMPLSSNPLSANDFVSSCIYPFIMCPLFRYSNGKLEKLACKNITIKGNTYYIELNDNIRYNNGKYVTIEDYYETFVKIMNSITYPKYLIENIKKINLVNNKLIIVLKRKDLFFLHKLTYYSFSPFKDELNCGQYYIDNISENSIILKRNEYFNLYTPKKEMTLKFNKYEKHEDIKAFLNNEIQVTNITTFPLERVKELKPEIKESNLMFVLKFSPNLMLKNYKKFRQYIASIIDKNRINKKLNNMFIIKNDFCLNNDANININYNVKKQKKLICKQNIKLGYTDFYPNKIIANAIKNQLTKNDIDVELRQYNLCKPNDCDIYIDIIFSPFFYDEYFYLSKYFRIVNGQKYTKLCNKYEKMQKEKIYQNIIKICYNNANVIPILKSKYIYLYNKSAKGKKNKGNCYGK